MNDDASDTTDAAALGAGVVAVAMTVFGDPSAYDLLTVIVSAALMLLVLGYVAAAAATASRASPSPPSWRSLPSP